MEVDAEIDELLSDGDGEARSSPGPSGAKDYQCKWVGCGILLDNQETLVKHLHEQHIGAGKETYSCQWSDCQRKGQTQATRHSLITHCRAHTGERPYTCRVDGCGKTFTRSDAMNKHLRSLHGIFTEAPNRKKAKDQSGMASQRSLPASIDEKTYSVVQSTKLPILLHVAPEAELLDDFDLADVLPRMRARDKFWTVTAEDETAMRMFRERFPRKVPLDATDESDDSFDEGRSAHFPREPIELPKEPGSSSRGGGDLPFLSRSRWQVRYMVAKAKLMLVEEEGSMRRRRLAELMAEEKRLIRIREAEGSYEAS